MDEHQQQLELVFQERFEALNEQQKKAVQTIEGPVLVIAGPGSGKTELLSLRVANILRETDTLPSSILCLTFTDSASVNMQKRLENLIGGEAYKVAVHTFHSFGREVISQYPEYFYKGASYSPADEITQLQILQEIFEALPHDSTLGSYHPEHGYTYIKEAKQRIGDLKKSGLSPSEFKTALEGDKAFLSLSAPLIAETFEGRIDKTILDKVAALIPKLTEIQASPGSKAIASKSLQQKIIESLGLALDEAKNGDKKGTTHITEWKQKYTKKNEQKKTVLKDADRLEKNFDLVNIYEQYLQKLQEKGLFDYDDMLLDVAKALELHADLRFTLQEKYLYILVDEFQDTNGVQMRLLNLLLDSELNEGRPNIMAVGDDDQAIYKFQGANLENILGFHTKFRDPETVVLTKNYRSTQQILDFARKMIVQGEDRLETRLDGNIRKDLIAGRANLPIGKLVEKEFETSFEELFWVARTIQQLIKDGHCKPSEIAVLSPVHRILENAAKTLNYFGIPIAYERKQNLLEDQLIMEIVTILQFVDSMMRDDQEEADHLLPTILSFEFWGINRVAMWRLARTAMKSRKGWVEAMLSSDSNFIKSIAKFFIDLAAEAKEKTLEEIIDRITGVVSVSKELPNDEHDDELDQHSLDFGEHEKFTSPFKEFYFNERNIDNNESHYFEHLENLRAFIAKIREYHSENVLYVKDALEFIRLLKDNDVSLHHTLKFSTDDNAVQLMTVHKAKGQEFETVFVLNCQDNAWIRRRGDKLQFPSNLPLSSESETQDDVLRLFYVAITRAKYDLYLTRHIFDDKGREQMHLRFIADGADENSKEKRKKATVDIEEAKARFSQEYGAEKFFELHDEIRRHEPISEDEKHLLKSTVQNYRLSVTHLTNFLNVIDGGPQLFLERNLLRFPQMISPPAAFGSAMHEALAIFYLAYKQNKKLPTLEFLQKQFDQNLANQRLNKNDYKKRLEKGLHDLKIFYDTQHATINPNDKVEVNFVSQQVIVNGATLSGKIDRMHIEPSQKEITVIDYKTGKTFHEWEPSDERLQFKAWQYKMQLIFYKLLVENSREYRGKVVNRGVLEFLEPKNNQILTLDLLITDEDVDRMKKLVGIVYQKIMNLDFPDISKYDKDLFGIGVFIEDLLHGRI